MINIFQMLGASFFLVISLMTFFWLIYFFKKNVNIVSLAWPLGFVLAGWSYFCLGEGIASKRFIIVLLVTIWGMHSAWNVYRRYIKRIDKNHYPYFCKDFAPKEFAQENDTEENYNRGDSDFKFFMIFIFQGVLIILLSLPFLMISAEAIAKWHAVEVVAILLWIIGMMGKILADQQLLYFKSLPENKEILCKKGLWYYSQQPDNFFEFIIWMAYFLFALGTPDGWVAIISPLVMLIILLKNSNVPKIEQALEEKREITPTEKIG